MTRRRNHRKGNALVEFTLAGIPLIFVLISTVEIARGMWLYNTLTHAIKEGTRYAVVHGSDCTVSPNSCYVTIRDIAKRISGSGVGLVPSDLQNVQFITNTRPITCPTLAACLQPGSSGDTYWPSTGPTLPGTTADVGSQQGAYLEIRAQYPFRSSIAMLWPGASNMTFGTFMLHADSVERIRY